MCVTDGSFSGREIFRLYILVDDRYLWDVLKCWNEFYVELLSAGVSIKEIENCGCEKPVYT